MLGQRYRNTDMASTGNLVGQRIRFPGGQCFKTLQMKTSSRLSSMAARISVIG
jgi:hypothetical protein